MIAAGVSAVVVAHEIHERYETRDSDSKAEGMQAGAAALITFHS